MPPEYCLLSDIADIIVGFPFESEQFNTDEKGVKLVRGMNVTTGNFRWGEDSRWWSNLTPDLEPYYLRTDDIIIGMDGSRVGKNYAKVQESDLPLLLVQRVACIRAKEGINQNYLWACIASASFEEYIDLVKTGTTIPHISGRQIGEFPVPKLDQNVQNIIGDISRLLDSKIYLNQKINDNLLTIRNEIFNNWVNLHTAGEIVSSVANNGFVSLDEMCSTVTDGSHFSPESDENGTHAMFSVKDMEIHGFNRKNCKMIGDESFEKMKSSGCVPQVDDVLIAKDGSYLKQLFLVNEPMDDAILSSIAIFRPNQAVIYPEILLAYLQSTIVYNYVKDNYVSGSAVPRIVLKSFKQLHIALPELSIQKEIIDSMRTIRFLIESNSKLVVQLECIRDYLLPKLMSGEIDVSTLEMPN